MVSCTKLCTSTVRQHLGSAGVGHGAMIAGILLAWSSLAIPQLRQQEGFTEMSEVTVGWISNISLLGALIAVVPTGLIVDSYGRRLAMLLSSLPIIVGWIGIILAQSVGMLYIGRFVAGISVGAFSVVLPIYVTEIAESERRGMIGYTYLQHIFAGALFVTIIGHVMEWSWKVLVYKSIPVAIIFCLAAYFLPESPVYLFGIGEKQRGSDALKWFRTTTSQESLEAEISEIQSSAVESINLDQPVLTENHSSLSKRIMIPAILMFLQQCTCGTHFVLGTVSITQAITSGQSDQTTSILVTTTVTAFVTLAIAAHVVDRIGRRPLLMVSCLLMALTLFVLGISFYVQSEMDVSNRVNWIRVLSFAGYIWAFSVGLGPISWLLMAELVPTRRKGFWAAVVTLFNWIPAFFIGMYFPSVEYFVTLPGFLWICAFISLCAALFSYLFVPETTKKSSFEIQSVFEDEDMLKMEYPI